MSEDADQDQRKYEPTPKRRADFRRQGQIAQSKDLTQVVSLLGGAGLGLAFSDQTVTGLVEYVAAAAQGLATMEPGQGVIEAGKALGRAALPATVGALAGAVITGGLQLGAPPAMNWPSFDLSRLANPQQLMELFSPKKQLARAAKAVAKIAVVGGAAAWAARMAWLRYLDRPAVEAPAMLHALSSATTDLVTYAGGALGVLAIIDYALARRRIHRRMMMTPEEMKREMREQEGDPMIKRKRRQRMRELGRRRFGAAVKSADVVLVNPTEYAVAIRYRSRKDKAPRVVAKGKGKVAERIRELARQNQVPIVVQIPLARFLYRAVPEGKEIPANVYKAVAEILGYVYRQQRRSAA